MLRFIPLAFILIITSCVSNETSDSKDVNQAEIYQTYRINCVEGNTSVTASFRFGGENGTTLRLSKPASITYNQKSLTESKFLLGGAFYRQDNAGTVAKHIFLFTDVDGKKYVNSYDFEPVEFINTPKKASKSENLVLPVTRRINANEAITFRAECDTIKFNETTIGNSAADLVYYNDSAQALIVKPAFFEGFIDIPAKMWMEKSEFRAKLEETTNLPGEMHFSYQSKVISVVRKDKKQ
ncbi:MAG: hypothetical protein ABIQ40_18735 [Bacteroidia bacterium]